MTFSTPVATNGVTFADGSGEATVAEAGTYLVMPTVNPATAGEFTVELNGAPVAGGVLPNVGTTSTGAVIVTANAGDRITVVNTGADAAALNAADGAVPNATLYIQRLADAPASV